MIPQPPTLSGIRVPVEIANMAVQALQDRIATLEAAGQAKSAEIARLNDLLSAKDKDNKRLTFERELIEADWEMLAAFIFEEKLNDLFKSWNKVNYDQWYKRSYPKWGNKPLGQDSSLAIKNAALVAEIARLTAAGDAMYNAAVQDSTGLWLLNPFRDWAKAKKVGANLDNSKPLEYLNKDKANAWAKEGRDAK